MLLSELHLRLRGVPPPLPIIVSMMDAMLTRFDDETSAGPMVVLHFGCPLRPESPVWACYFPLGAARRFLSPSFHDAGSVTDQAMHAILRVL
jgi:hypothetical protein